MDRALRLHCQKRRAAMLAERQPFEADWKTVSDYIDPYAGRALYANNDQNKLPSRAKIINSHAANCVRTMDAGFMGGHTSKSRPWFRLTVSDPALSDRWDVRAWLDAAAQILRDILAKSNFYTELPDFYHFRHLYGVAAMACMEDDKDVVRFYTFPIGTYAIGQDARLKVDAFTRSYTLSAEQIRDKFAAKLRERGQGLPPAVQSALDEKRFGQRFTIESVIEPNPEAKPGMQASESRPYRFIDYLAGSGETTDYGCLAVGGDYDMPVLVSRWNAYGADLYGSSPALEALGDIKQLQYLEGEKLRLIDLTSQPPLFLPDTLRNKGASLQPGGKIFVTPSQTQQIAGPAYTPDPRAVLQVQAEIDKVQMRVDRAFYADLFRMLDFLDDRQRTAYEISERKEEKVAMLGPALESLTDDVLDPVVARVYGIAERNGLIPPPPQAMANRPVVVEYTSMLAQAQKAAGVGSIERTIAFVAQLAQATGSPKPFRKLDLYEAIDQYADRTGAPAAIIRADEDVQAEDEADAQQQQMAQMAQMAGPLKDAATAMRTMGEAMPLPGSVAEQAQALAGAA